jgi:hypothetical protein
MNNRVSEISIYPLIDPDVEGDVELRRIVGIEWKIMRPARDSQLVERNGHPEVEEEYMAYLINEELHAMIHGAEDRNVNHTLRLVFLPQTPLGSH